MDYREKLAIDPSGLPPQVPETAEERNRVICLLGNRTKSDLKRKAQQELIDLIGIYPSVEQATEWKRNLRQLVKSESI